MIYPDALQALMMQLPRPETQRMVSTPPITGRTRLDKT